MAKTCKMAPKSKVSTSPKEKVVAKSENKMGHTAKQRTGKVKTWTTK
jgi:hypothetical protein